jgi:hypothetical protein
MTDLIVVPQAAHWHRLKGLVLDSVSSPITKRVYNLGLDEFFAWYELESRALDQDTCIKILGECAFLPAGPIGIVNLRAIPEGLNAKQAERFLRKEGRRLAASRGWRDPEAEHQTCPQDVHS